MHKRAKSVVTLLITGGSRRMSDIMLFRYGQNHAEELAGKAVLTENHLQVLIEAQMEAFLGVWSSSNISAPPMKTSSIRGCFTLTGC